MIRALLILLCCCSYAVAQSGADTHAPGSRGPYLFDGTVFSAWGSEVGVIPIAFDTLTLDIKDNDANNPITEIRVAILNVDQSFATLVDITQAYEAGTTDQVVQLGELIPENTNCYIFYATDGKTPFRRADEGGHVATPYYRTDRLLERPQTRATNTSRLWFEVYNSQFLSQTGGDDPGTDDVVRDQWGGVWVPQIISTEGIQPGVLEIEHVSSDDRVVFSVINPGVPRTSTWFSEMGLPTTSRQVSLLDRSGYVLTDAEFATPVQPDNFETVRLDASFLGVLINVSSVSIEWTYQAEVNDEEPGDDDLTQSDDEVPVDDGDFTAEVPESPRLKDSQGWIDIVDAWNRLRVALVGISDVEGDGVDALSILEDWSEGNTPFDANGEPGLAEDQGKLVLDFEEYGVSRIEIPLLPKDMEAGPVRDGLELGRTYGRIFLLFSLSWTLGVASFNLFRDVT